MKSTHNNPPTNILGAGINEADILTDISKSGYPLQTLVANNLRDQSYRVQQEWDFVDRNTEKHRAIDILAEKELFESEDFNEKLRVRPKLNLIIECKKSELPFIFFLSPSKPHVADFPLFAGLFQDEIVITTDDTASTFADSITHSLGLRNHPFLTQLEFCMSFTKCIRNSKGLEFSGNEPYNEIVLPLIKAMNQFKLVESPPKTALYFDCHLAIGVGIIDGPMVGINILPQSIDAILLPWVRIVRHEYTEGEYRHEREKLYAVDIIHKDFFQTYLDQHVIPFANEFSKMSIKHQQELASGKGFATGMDKNSFTDVEKRLVPRKISTDSKRSKEILKNVAKVLTGRDPDD